MADRHLASALYGGAASNNPITLSVLTDNTLSFEGATNNDYETTVTVVDPTADRTITLPNVDGTVITTGNLSSITSTGTLSSLVITGDVTIDTNTLKVDSTNNRVGIGTSSPASALDVVGDVALTGSVIFEGATADAFETTLSVTDPTADRTITLPNKSGTVATTADLGLVYVANGTFSGATTASISSVFSSTYDNYRLVLSNITTDSSLLYLICINLRATSTDSTTGYYSVLSGMLWSGTTEAYGLENSTFGIVGAASSSGDSSIVMDICRPNIADNTNITVQNSSYFGTYTGAMRHSVATAYNGFTFSTFRLGASPANINATWKLYGYTN